MINAYIGTFNNKTLSVGAAKYLRKNIVENINIILICGKNQKSDLEDPIFDDYVEHEWVSSSRRSVGFNVAFGVADQSENIINLYIDDDLRLMEKITINSRYPNNLYGPSYCKMIYIWKGSMEKYLLTRQTLQVIRVENKSNCYGWNDRLSSLAIDNHCERIDDIWLHIDKGSILPWPPVKKELIDYLDNNI